MNNIPRILHLIAKDKHRVLQNSHALQFFNGWDIRIYDDADADLLAQRLYPTLYGSYLKLPLAIQRMDISRLMAVFKYGGFYMDTDMILFKPIDELLPHNGLVLAVEKILRNEEMQLPCHKHAVRIANYMFGSIPQHPFLEYCITRAIGNAGREIRSETDVLEATGPGLITNLFHEQSAGHHDILLIENNTLHCRKHCTPQPSCHFGSYGAHLHQGSWRGFANSRL